MLIDANTQITDDISGVADGVTNGGGGPNPVSNALWESPSGEQSLGGGIFTNPESGNDLDGIYSDTITLNRFSENGTWTLVKFFTGDESGNTKTFSTDELDALGIQTTFEVAGGIEDIAAPKLISYDLSSYAIDLS